MMEETVSMSPVDVNNVLKSLAVNRAGARLVFFRGEQYNDLLFNIASFEEGIGMAICRDRKVAIQFVVEDVKRVEVCWPSVYVHR